MLFLTLHSFIIEYVLIFSKSLALGTSLIDMTVYPTGCLKEGNTHLLTCYQRIL